MKGPKYPGHPVLAPLMPATTEPVTIEEKFDFVAQFNLLQAAHDANDRRLVARVLHSLPKARKSLDSSTISSLEAFSKGEKEYGIVY